MNDENSDRKLVNFLKQYRPNVPDAAPDFEQKVLAAIQRNDAASELNHLGDSQFIESCKSSKKFRFPKWTFPAAIAAALLVFGSGYRALVTAQLHADETAHLEAFLVNNWEGVLNDSHTENLLDCPQTDWLTLSTAADSETPTNN